MNSIPLVSFELLSVGDIVKGQDENKYIYCRKANISYWEPYICVAEVTQNVEEKFHWKDNKTKPKYENDEGDSYNRMAKALKPKVSPNDYPAGYVWTTKFCDISYVVDTGYKGSSKTISKFWNTVYFCPPCVDANDYPFKYVFEDGVECAEEYYYVEYDEEGNKFWCNNFDAIDEICPLRNAYKYVEGTSCKNSEGSTWWSCREMDGFAYWGAKNDENYSDEDDSEEE